MRVDCITVLASTTGNSLKADTFGTGTKCPSESDACLIHVVDCKIKRARKKRNNSWCPFYRGVR